LATKAAVLSEGDHMTSIVEGLRQFKPGHHVQKESLTGLFPSGTKCISSRKLQVPCAFAEYYILIGNSHLYTCCSMLDW